MSFPLVSMGMPVFNGERFLERTLQVLLAQTFEDFELVVVDNASTDRTAEILADHAARDARIRVVRNPQNIGAAPNWNRAFELTRAPFFKWVAYDDLYEATFVERTLEILRRDPSLVLCASQSRLIDEAERDLPRDPATGLYRDRAGNLRHGPPLPGRARSPNPVERFRDIYLHTVRCFDVFSLMRADLLRRSALHRSYYGSDRSLLVELSLLGRFEEVPEPLFMKREHVATSLSLSPTEKAKWIDAKGGRTFLPQRLKYQQIAGSILRSPLSASQKARCFSVMAGTFNWSKLAGGKLAQA